MTDQELQERLRRWYAAEVGNDKAAPASLYNSVTALSVSVRLQPGSHALRSRPLLLAAAALLVGLIAGSVAIGSGLVKLPAILPVPTASPSVPRLAYGIDGDIYLADWDGGNAVLVADGISPEDGSQCGYFGGEGLMWAPDGHHFAYRKPGNDTCSGEVHVADAEGRPVASVPGFGWDVWWSPDSTRIATWVEFGTSIAIYNLEGERQALLTVPLLCGGSGDHDPRWSLDGTSIVVPSSCEIPIDGGPTSRDPGYRWVYSPDGTRVAHVTHTGDGETFDSSVVITEASGTVLQIVHEESAPSPSYANLVWSPSGDRVVFSWTPRGEDGYAVDDASSELRQVDIGSGQVTTIAAKPGFRPIRFSPDGDRILFAAWDGSQVGEERYTGLWSVNADGSHMQLLVPNTGFGDWQPLPDSD